ncbi:pilus assembly protein [Nocardioides anomalus]|uniref:Pilus assembly protein n=1 Tax=Nocardioides anomalus TaxID=2712223 RepID=A0A6G6WAX4_9ACTN|nr:TadE/TadG family type IV pilus assembly protein [Nocardioides anomalus]QIG42366.1 pilus assembly protein [Nocardioides anomalus]
MYWMRRSRARSERGAVAVEAALVTPLLLILVFGIIEMSLLMRDVMATSSAVRVGARMASTAAGAGPGTCKAGDTTCTPQKAPRVAQVAADAIQRAGSAMPKDSIDWILVYRANTSGYPLPDSNKSLTTCSTDCVKYVWDKDLDKFRYLSGQWDSRSINACVNDASLMAVGVAMRSHHDWITGFFGNGVDLEERTVMQFEPLDNNSCKPGTLTPHP